MKLFTDESELSALPYMVRYENFFNPYNYKATTEISI